VRQKVSVVTGANSGIGLITARALADRGDRVLMACRSEARGNEARAEVVERTGNPDVEVVRLDLASLASVRAAAAEIVRRAPALDCLVNNAGYLPGARRVTDLGVEESFLVNHLGPFLLTNLLIDALAASPAARVVNVSSEVHRLVAMPFDDLAFEKRYGAYYTYSVGKLGNVMFTHELARRLDAAGRTNIDVNALHPGYIASHFGGSSRPYIRFGIRLARPFLMTPEQGARGQIRLATDPDLAGTTGRYFKGRRPSRPSRHSRDAAACARLWDVSAELTGLGVD